MANVKVRLKDASNNVLHPETDWSVVLNKPSIKLQYTDGSYSTSTDSMVAVVSGRLGRDGEAWDTYSKDDDGKIDGGKSIVIGNSDNALGFCGTNSKQLFTILQSKRNILIGTEGNISISSKDTGNKSVSLADYPIKWSAISDKPDYIPANTTRITFGHYSTLTDNPTGIGFKGAVYPAIRTLRYNNAAGALPDYTCYYFNGTSWTELPDGAEFIPGF